jgi:hypothetical protein
MNQQPDALQLGWARTARRGASLAAGLVATYSLSFLGYAVARSTLRLVAIPELDGGLIATLLATWLSLAVPVAVFAVFCTLPATLLGAATALLVRALLVRSGAARGRVSAALLGGGVCLALSLVLIALLALGLGLVWSRGAAEALTFWLGLPLVLYIIAGALASYRLQPILAVAEEQPSGAADGP